MDRENNIGKRHQHTKTSLIQQVEAIVLEKPQKIKISAKRPLATIQDKILQYEIKHHNNENIESKKWM